MIVVDLDSTVADTRNRSRSIPDDWIAYAEQCEDDRVHLVTAALVWDLQKLHRMYYLSARPMTVFTKTARWLTKYKFEFEGIQLAPESITTGSLDGQAAWKVECVRSLDGIERVEFIIDDAPQVCKAMEVAGIPALMVPRPWNT